MKYLLLRQIFYSFFLLIAMFFAIPAMADDSDATIYQVSDSAPIQTSGGVGTSSDLPDVASPSSSSESDSYVQGIIGAVVWVVHKLYILIGLSLMLGGFYCLKLYADAPMKHSLRKCLAMIVFGALMFNMLDSVNITMNTLRGEKSGVCFVSDSELASKLSTNNNCWDTAVSEMSGKIADRVNKVGDTDTTQKLLGYLKIFISIAQVFGYIYFGIGITGLYKYSNGSSREWVFKPLIVVIASCLIIDLPHTFQLFIEFLQKIGVNV